MSPVGTFKPPKKPDPVAIWWKGLPRETRTAILSTAGCSDRKFYGPFGSQRN